MRIVIDMQGAQSTGSRNRGIGRYTLSLTRAIIRNRGEHEIILALNGLFPETIESIRADFDALLPQENIRVWYAPGPVNSLETDNNWRRKSAELLREAFIASLIPDMVLVTSLFEGWGDDAVTSIGVLSRNAPTATILFDLIPLIHRQLYLENPGVEAWYEKKLEHLRRSDLLLAISESSRQESIRYLGFEERATVNISTAADHQFQSLSISSQQETEIRERYKLHRPYVMYTGGIDHRKNIEGLIRAYASLPKALRAQHQLAVVCAIESRHKTRFENLAKQHLLKKDELILTGFIPEEDLLTLYGLCKLFVFPSWHEGFGLPALEAMSCGRAVIGANTSSVPEVIGLEDALFDPRSDESITEKLTQVLTDDSFRYELERHGLEQAKKFSWDRSASLTISALEKLYAENQQTINVELSSVHKPKMAYISPLPPECSGISDYSAELLSELSRHYDIDVIVAQDSVTGSWINENIQIRDAQWLRLHADDYDRILYHFGNSDFHRHMFSLLDEVPGIVVLHDFFLSGIVAHMDINGLTSNGLVDALYKSHGYKAVQERYHVTELDDVVYKYPCNLSVLRGAQGIIVHSESSRELAKHWYTTTEADHWSVIQLLRVPVFEFNRTRSRDILNLNVDDFVICSFGLLNPTKLNHRLLDAWLASDLAKNDHCVLIFVGENNVGEYGQDMIATIHRSRLSKRIRITGWVETETFRHYLAAADVGVQLRTLSRGETSAAVLDCMNYGLPTIVNANGSMADIADDAVWKLPDNFSNDQMITALETLWSDKLRRTQLGDRAREIILKYHAPDICADQYFATIENIYRSTGSDLQSLMCGIAEVKSPPVEAEKLIPLAEAISKSIPQWLAPKQLLVDVSDLVQRDSKSDITHVVRSILREWISCPPEGLRVEPVYATKEQGYRYARRFTLEFLGCPPEILIDDPIEYQPGDFFLGLDFQPHRVSEQKDFFQQLRRHGVQVQFVFYELLYVFMPQHSAKSTKDVYGRWLEVVIESDGVVCISKSVAQEVHEWYMKYTPERLRPFKVSWFHLGVDIERSVTSQGMLDDTDAVMKEIHEHTSFLIFCTKELCKGCEQTLAAFEQLWLDSVDVNLVIVAKSGWMDDGLIEKPRQNIKSGKNLFWLEDISDEFIGKIYACSTCLIASSEGEVFGLPIIEAAQHKLPIIARDTPVFREVAGNCAFYFDGNEPAMLAVAIRDWLSLYEINQHPGSESLPLQTWKQSASQLLDVTGINAKSNNPEIIFTSNIINPNPNKNKVG